MSSPQAEEGERSCQASLRFWRPEIDGACGVVFRIAFEMLIPSRALPGGSEGPNEPMVHAASLGVSSKGRSGEPFESIP